MLKERNATLVSYVAESPNRSAPEHRRWMSRQFGNTVKGSLISDQIQPDQRVGDNSVT
jgi:hypothetical protein